MADRAVNYLLPLDKGFDPNQPRVPAGNSTGGQFASSGGGAAPLRSPENAGALNRDLYSRSSAFFDKNSGAARAVMRYQREGALNSRVINSALRGAGTRSKTINEAITQLDKAVSVELPKGVTLHRGTSFLGGDKLPGTYAAARQLVGESFVERGYSSSSIGVSNFVSGSNQMVRIHGATQGVLVMAARKSKAVSQAVSRGRLTEGGEVLLPRNLTYKVTGVSEASHPSISGKSLIVYDVSVSRPATKAYGLLFLDKMAENQPRAPAGTSTGGQWTSAGGGGKVKVGGAVTVFHGTGSNSLKSILDRGLLPGKAPGVFVATSKRTAIRFAQQNVGIRQDGMPGVRAVVLEIRIPKHEFARYAPDHWLRKGAAYHTNGSRIPASWIKSHEFVKVEAGSVDYSQSGAFVTRWLVVTVKTGANPLLPLDKKYNPNQPRVPAGNSTGGQWASRGGAGGGSTASASGARLTGDLPGYKPAPARTATELFNRTLDPNVTADDVLAAVPAAKEKINAVAK